MIEEKGKRIMKENGVKKKKITKNEKWWQDKKKENVEKLKEIKEKIKRNKL